MERTKIEGSVVCEYISAGFCKSAAWLWAEFRRVRIKSGKWLGSGTCGAPSVDRCVACHVGCMGFRLDEKFGVY